MKCQMCDKTTDWDSSVGYPEFIVCNKCFDEMAHHNPKNYSDILKVIFWCGEERREKMKHQKECL